MNNNAIFFFSRYYSFFFFFRATYQVRAGEVARLSKVKNERTRKSMRGELRKTKTYDRLAIYEAGDGNDREKEKKKYERG